MPNTKILVTLILCIAVLSSVAIFEWKTGVKILTPNNTQNLEVGDSATTTNANSNLKSWQNTLSEITGTTTDITSYDATQVDNSNLTAQMAKNYFGQFLTLSQNGQQTVTDTDANQIALNTLTTTSGVSQGKVYTMKNINLKTTTADNINAYFNAFGTSLKKNNVILRENELDILNQAVISEKQSDIDKLNPIIVGYNNILTDLIKMPVPNEASNIHLELLNATSNIVADMTNMKSTLTDPVKGLTAIKLYQTDYENFTLSLQKIWSYFKIKKIIK